MTTARATGRLLPVLAALLCFAGVAPAEPPPAPPELSLTATAEQPETLYPFRQAELTFHTPTHSDATRYLSIRCTDGGPTIVLPVTISPQATPTIRVPLPAFSAAQTYRVTFLVDRHAPPPVWNDDPPGAVGTALGRSTGGSVPAPVDVEILWPDELVTKYDFLDAARVDEYLPRLPAWPTRTRETALAGVVLFAAALAALLLVRRPLLRAVILLVVVLAGAGAALAWRYPPLQLHALENRQYLLTTRRTIRIPSETPNDGPTSAAAVTLGQCYPVYATRRQMRQEDMVLFWDLEPTVELTAYPDEVRLFIRRGKSLDP